MRGSSERPQARRATLNRSISKLIYYMGRRANLSRYAWELL